ncbi:MAG: DEAD/DEAH box helicase [Bacteroidetes bacterium]|nr:DEAD/DEAH box helicase [Bacteroidota bacterium]HET6243328.1 DEAD/DEAH box helicase [Bacteroidia bacterium]
MNNFESLGINEKLLKAVASLGFEKPSPIQEQAIPVLLDKDTDLVGLAQTGTGKTAAFGLPLLQKVDFTSRDTQAIILCPTRELCVQITKDLGNFAKFIEGTNIVPVYGGASIDTQIRQISRGAQIIVATPGRMADMINRKKADLSKVRWVVLDEADEMLDMGFKDELDIILGKTPQEKNTWLFSATMEASVARIASNYMNNPIEVSVGGKNVGAANISHEYYVVHAKDRFAALKRLVDSNPDIFGLIFCRTRMETQEIAEKLIKDGYSADALHGDLSQQQRDKVMSRFRSKSIQLLIATDVAARGIDVEAISHVIHYSLPDDIENYTHRSGRTARAGKTGISMAIINMKEVGKIRELERKLKSKFEKKSIPTGFEVVEKQLFSLVKEVHDVKVNEEEIKPYLDKILIELGELSKEEIIKRFVSIEFNRMLNYYKNAQDLNADTSRSTSKERGERGERSSAYTRFFINLGVFDNINKSAILRIVCEGTGLSGQDIGRIDVKDSFSFFEVDSSKANVVIEELNKDTYDGREIKVEVSSAGREEESRGRGRSSGGGFGEGGAKKSYGKSGGGYKGGGGSSYGSKAGGSDSYSKKKDYSSDKKSGGGSGSREGGKRKRINK